jgi:hypothetical protein
MTDQGFRDLLNELGTLKIQHRAEFEAWYDQTGATSFKLPVAVHDLTFTGWLIERKLQ